MTHERTCGKCSACCIAPSISQSGFEKPMYEPCKHLGQVGCGIYATRPGLCRRFRCGWLDGADTERPDILGAVYWFSHLKQTGRTLIVLELSIGSFENGAILQHCGRVAAEGYAVLMVPREGAITLRLPRRFMLLTGPHEPVTEDQRPVTLVHL